MKEALISSRTRIKLLMKFFVNSSTTAYLRSLESEFGESSNAIRIELNRLEEAGMLKSFMNGNKKMYQANDQHPLFSEIRSILLKTIGIDQIIEKVIQRLGAVRQVFLIGEFAKGLDSPVVDLIITGNVDKQYLLELAERAETLISRKIRYLVLAEEEFDSLRQNGHYQEAVLLWSHDA